MEIGGADTVELIVLTGSVVDASSRRFQRAERIYFQPDLKKVLGNQHCSFDKVQVILCGHPRCSSSYCAEC